MSTVLHEKRASSLFWVDQRYLSTFFSDLIELEFGYGLRPSPRAWFDRFSCAMKKFSYSQSQANNTLSLKSSAALITVLNVYVDDIVVMGNKSEDIKRILRS